MHFKNISNVKDLKQYINEGNTVDYHLFWKSHLGQWTRSPFIVEGVVYYTAEHWMMASKAKLFGDEKMYENILLDPSPKNAKDMGRIVSNFDAKVWDENCIDIVAIGNYHKFKQHPDMRRMLMNTKGKVLVEASPYDAIWGIKRREDDQLALDVDTWRGKNYLGFALMKTRNILEDDNTGMFI
jgi:ribA/ribD-fused uncharacterized protein